jgi:hypothetical protein
MKIKQKPQYRKLRQTRNTDPTKTLGVNPGVHELVDDIFVSQMTMDLLPFYVYICFTLPSRDPGFTEFT